MTFIYEMISDEDGAKAHWGQYAEYWRTGKRRPSTWAIDRDLNAYIWCVRDSIPGWSNAVFGLYCQGGGIRAEAREWCRVPTHAGSKRCNAYWEIVNISLLESSEPQRYRIGSVIQEALAEYVRALNPEGIENVFVSLP